MDLEQALNLGLPPYQVERIASGDRFRAQISGYPQCTGFGTTAEEAVRVARHLYTQLRDGQVAAALTDLQDDGSDRIRAAARRVVARALLGKPDA